MAPAKRRASSTSSLRSWQSSGGQPGEAAAFLGHLDLAVVELCADDGPADGPATEPCINSSSLERYIRRLESKLALRSDGKGSTAEGGDACGPFPVVLLSYTDLVEACDAVQFLAGHRHDAVLVFAPHFVIGEAAAPSATIIQSLRFLSQSRWRWRSNWP